MPEALNEWENVSHSLDITTDCSAYGHEYEYQIKRAPDIWSRGHVGTQSWSDPRPANTHVIKTDMVAPILHDLWPGQDLIKKTARRHRCVAEQLQDKELMICCSLQSFWSQ